MAPDPGKHSVNSSDYCYLRFSVSLSSYVTCVDHNPKRGVKGALWSTRVQAPAGCVQQLTWASFRLPL